MYVTRQNQSRIFESFSSPFITALIGPRRVGKTTLVEHYKSQFPDRAWVLLNMDRMEERQRAQSGQLLQMIEERSLKKVMPGADIWIAIDEAQKCPALFDQIKLLYDEYKDREAIRFILTGSGHFSLHQLAAENLAGRIEIYHLREFNLREATSLQEKASIPPVSFLNTLAKWGEDPTIVAAMISHLSSFRPLLVNTLKTQLIWGGLPELLQLQTTDQRIRYLANYLQTYLEKDIRAITTVSDLALYQKLMDVIAEQTGSLRDDKRTVDALSCSRDTLKKYRGYLGSTLMYHEVYPYIGSVLKRIVKSPKAYLTNNGLLSYLTGFYEMNILEKSGLIGHRFENWFLKELQICLDHDPRRSEIYFWRSSGGVEVDFVFKKHPVVFPLELTYALKPDRRKIKHLQAFLNFEKKAPYGFYIYNGEYRYDKDSKIFFIPAWAI